MLRFLASTLHAAALSCLSYLSMGGLGCVGALAAPGIGIPFLMAWALTIPLLLAGACMTWVLLTAVPAYAWALLGIGIFAAALREAASEEAETGEASAAMEKVVRETKVRLVQADGGWTTTTEKVQFLRPLQAAESRDNEQKR